MSAERPNIMVFLWDGYDWRKLGWYGEGVAHGAPTSRLDSIAAHGLQLGSFDVEAQRHPCRTALLTRPHGWEVRLAEALSALGYATEMWGERHRDSDPDERSSVDAGFQEAMQSYFPDGDVTATPRPEVISTFDAEFRAVFDRVITSFAIDFMGRAESDSTPSPVYLYVPYIEARTTRISDPEYVGRTKPGNRAEIGANVA